jgi:hypothetical protein
MNVRAKLHVGYSGGKIHLAGIESEVEWAPQWAWARWRREKFVCTSL